VGNSIGLVANTQYFEEGNIFLVLFMFGWRGVWLVWCLKGLNMIVKTIIQANKGLML